MYFQLLMFNRLLCVFALIAQSSVAWENTTKTLSLRFSLSAHQLGNPGLGLLTVRLESYAQT